MLTAEENERLTRVGSGTPMGDLFRRYWQPIAAVAQLDENPVKAVRLFGEDLTLFKDKKVRLGLIADRCAHRHVKLVYGIPEEEGLRCCYHGWMYDRTGQCIEQPAEPADSRFKDKSKSKSKSKSKGVPGGGACGDGFRLPGARAHPSITEVGPLGLGRQHTPISFDDICTV